MKNVDLKEIVHLWYMGNPVRVSGKNSESVLFKMLYNAYCRIVNNGRNYDDTVQGCLYSEDCSEMFTWYRDRYTGLGLQKGGRGQKRYVTGSEEKYSFDLLYCDDRQFKSYLLTDTPQSGNQDLFCFILHTAVAFLVPTKELDSVLQVLGFHPLHVRNIHHLAIYTVLTTAQTYEGNMPEMYNPFDEVKTLYLKACEIVKSGKRISSDVIAFDDYLTRQIREELFLKKGLSYENFDSIVKNNVPALNMRHSMILNDFHKLAAVYTTIFEDYPEEAETYSFYQFVNRFCTSVSQKKFREYMSSMIDNNQKHPTRQIMILLWFYDYCFSFIDGIPLSDDIFEKIQKKLAIYNRSWAKEAEEYRCNLKFDAYGFINNVKNRYGSNQFCGSDFLAVLNKKLMARYGWGYLNKRLPFDYYYLSMSSMNIVEDARFGDVNRLKISFLRQDFTDICEDEAIAPYPLKVAIYLLEQLKAVIEEETGKLNKKKAKEISPFPLDCRIYEQI